ncbi:MAG: hypothetical protein K2O05_01005, partial [Anaeroplasmataceae bacterium]|nr:hypothetical protein [Anaeroplasmataceae bacterium]
MDNKKQSISKRINDFFLGLFGSSWYGISNILSGFIMTILLCLTTYALNQLSIRLNLGNDIIDVISNCALKIFNNLVLITFGITGVIKAVIENTRSVKNQIEEIKNDNNVE